MIINKKNKKAFALSIELVTVLVVIITLLSFGVGVAKRMLIDNKITNIITEYSILSSAINQFKHIYRYNPGDVPLKAFSGKMYDSDIISAYGIIMNGSDIFHQDRTNSIGVAKSMLSFAQLSKSGLLKFNYNLSKITDKCVPVKSLKKDIFMTTKYSKSAIWFFSIDSTASSSKVIENSVIYNSLNNATFSNHPKLTILNPNNLQDCTIDVESGIGAVSGEIMNYVEDRLLDDRNSNSGIIISDSKTGSTGCKNSDGSYIMSSSDSALQSCVVHMLI